MRILRLGDLTADLQFTWGRQTEIRGSEQQGKTEHTSSQQPGLDIAMSFLPLLKNPRSQKIPALDLPSVRLSKKQKVQASVSWALGLSFLFQSFQVRTNNRRSSMDLSNSPRHSAPAQLVVASRFASWPSALLLCVVLSKT